MLIQKERLAIAQPTIYFTAVLKLVRDKTLTAECGQRRLRRLLVRVP